jgi:hypothetical protein
MNTFTFNCYTDCTISYAVSGRLINAESWFIPREVSKGFVVKRMTLEEVFGLRIRDHAASGRYLFYCYVEDKQWIHYTPRFYTDIVSGHHENENTIETTSGSINSL